MKISAYQVAAVSGSALLMLSGVLRFQGTGNPKELFIGVLYFLANLLIFCL